MDLLTEYGGGLRNDGRRGHELRKIRCRLGVFSQSDGSAYIEQGNTKVLAAVYGPRPVRNKQIKVHGSVLINFQYSMAVFSTGERKTRPRGDRKTSEISLQLRQAVSAAIMTEVHPRSQIDIFVEVLQADGGNFCACVNAATLALIDAGIPMREYVVACSASLAGDTPLVDISHLEETLGGPNLTVAALPLSGKVAVMELSQKLHLDHLPRVLDCALKGCADIHAILDTAIKQHLIKVAGARGLGKKFHLGQQTQNKLKNDKEEEEEEDDEMSKKDVEMITL
ncbi:hypothetical protein WDU94_012710 [Cyamophila willieti]